MVASFEQLFEEYGLPYAICSDNGTPFSSTTLGDISRFYLPSKRIYTDKIEPYDYGEGVKTYQGWHSGEIK